MTIAANPEMSLLLEFVPQRLEIAGSDPEAILSDLTGNGFRLHEIVEPGNLSPAMGVRDVLSRLEHEKRLYTNLFVSACSESRTAPPSR